MVGDLAGYGGSVEQIGQAVILAAGEGQRLRPFTALKPKVMIPLANKPILQYVVEAVAAAGIREIVMVVGYRKEQVWDHFGDGRDYGAQIQYVVQQQQLGTAHALKQAIPKAQARFLVLCGDNIVSQEAIDDLLRAAGNAILVKERENPSNYGIVRLQDGSVATIVEKPQQSLSHLVSTGVYALSREVFPFIQEEPELPTALCAMIAAGRKIVACKTEGDWLDIVYPWDILKLNDAALAKMPAAMQGALEPGVTVKGQVAIGTGSVIRAGSYLVGPLVIGRNCEVGPNVCVLPSTSIGNNVCIFPFTYVQNSVIGDGVEIGPSSTIRDSIIDRCSRFGSHFTARSAGADVKAEDRIHRVQIGAMVGEHCTIEDDVNIAPGVILGNYCKVGSLKLVRDSVPDHTLVV